MAIKYFNLSPKNDAELITKLNVAADFERRKPHELGKLILEDALNELIAKNNLAIPSTNVQLADAG